MTLPFPRALAIGIGAVAMTALGGCYYGGVYGASYASAGGVCSDRYYDYDPYAYGDGYGYGCYDPYDYGAGFLQIGFGGGWYDDYYYPGYGLWMFDRYRNRHPLRGRYLDYWGGRRAWWRHHRHERGFRGDRPGGWNRHDRDTPREARPPRSGDWDRGDRPRRARPGRPDAGNGYSGGPGIGNPRRPGRGASEGAVPPRDRVTAPAPAPQVSAPPPVQRVRPAPPVRAAPMREPSPAYRSPRPSGSNAEDQIRED